MLHRRDREAVRVTLLQDQPRDEVLPRLAILGIRHEIDRDLDRPVNLDLPELKYQRLERHLQRHRGALY